METTKTPNKAKLPIIWSTIWYYEQKTEGKNEHNMLCGNDNQV